MGLAIGDPVRLTPDAMALMKARKNRKGTVTCFYGRYVEVTWERSGPVWHDLHAVEPWKEQEEMGQMEMRLIF